MKKILITGATGFIGSTSYKHLQRRGQISFVIDHHSFGDNDYVGIDDQLLIVEDIGHWENVIKISEQVDTQWAISLLAIYFIPYGNQFPIESAVININGTKNVPDTSRNAKRIGKAFIAGNTAQPNKNLK